MAKKYTSKYTGPEIDAGIDKVPVLEGKLTELESDIQKNTEMADKNLAELRDNTIQESEHLIADNDVAGYITDRDNVILAKLLKSGAIEFLVENAKDKENQKRFSDLESLMSYVSSEVPDKGDIVKYITDKDGAVIATINNVGEIEFAAGGGFDGEKTKSQNIAFDAIKVITDKDGAIIGWITSKGVVHIVEAEVEKLKVKDNSDIGLPEFLFPMLGIVASGVPNRKMVNDKTYNLIESFKAEYIKKGKEVISEPCITLYDDDALDHQLPTSNIVGATPTTRPGSSMRGGYASVLFPLVHAFNKKYSKDLKGKVICFTAGEGQRIGLTGLHEQVDQFSGQLNNNGQVLQRLIETGEWEVVCHSMTARYDDDSYVVDSLDSEFANEVLASGEWHGDLRYNTTCVYNKADGNNYQIKQDKSGWTLLPLHYAKPYCAVSLDANSPIIINPTYRVKYQVDEWFRRADVAGLSYSMREKGKRIYANWGSSHSIWHIKENMKYADYGFGGTANTNTIPVDTTIHRFSWQPVTNHNTGEPFANYTGDWNVYTDAEYRRITSMIDECVEKKGWSFLGSHMNEIVCYNYYIDNLINFNIDGVLVNMYDSERDGERLNYYDKDYPTEWAVPLKYDELQDIIGDNIHDYLNNPPSRLGIADWSEWYPCPGTGCALLWDALRYAMTKGVRFCSAAEGFERFGNLLTIGFKYTNGEVFPQDKKLGNIPEQNKSHCIIGADGSIDYESL